ncbi:MAG: ferrous iron transport protein A [Clostridiales bacterium]|nr:ferrous iron transport protein A [Clostridiales bacterium]
MTVFDLKRGERAEIERINIEGGARARLFSLGVKEGAEIQVLSYSLFRSSVLLMAGAVRVGIRKSLANKIFVKTEGEI